MRLHLQKPDSAWLSEFLREQKALPFSYGAVGASKETPPQGYCLDHRRTKLGSGEIVFEKAKSSLRNWEMFDLGWTSIYPVETPIREGEVVAPLIRIGGFWVVNACRIVYVVDERGPTEKFGFAYGTLPSHAERGEERFTIEWRHEDDSVWYDILAFSRPGWLLTWIAYPVVRGLQRRFAADSMERLIRVINPTDVHEA